MAAASEPDEGARTLGRYEILSPLGRGGMANVYLGRHAGEAGFSRLYAIKVLHAHLADEAPFVEMLLDEARLAARLHHPNVVPVVDLGCEEGIYYIVMEYVEGCTLSEILRWLPQERTPRLIIPVILDALAGLHAAHTLFDDDGNPMRLVHRDISPQNILIGVDGIARLTDFGIAKAESRINATRPGDLKGKVNFMSPEQIRRPDRIDHRSDLFSAGILLWTSLTGTPLFQAESSVSTLEKILQMPVPLPSEAGAHPPAVFDSVCLRALERDPDSRYQSALEMEEALRSAADSVEMLASRREIADWLKRAAGDRLDERRKRTRASGRQPVARRLASQSSGTMRLNLANGLATESSGRFRVEVDPQPPSATMGSKVTFEVTNRADSDGLGSTGAKSSRRTALIAGGLILASLAIGFSFMRAMTADPGPNVPSTASSHRDPTVPFIVTAPSLGPGPVGPEASKGPPSPSAQAEPASPPSAPAAAQAQKTVVPRGRAPLAPAPARIQLAAPRPERPARADSKPASGWDSDSPLPPP